MLEKFLAKQKEALDYFYAHFDPQQCAELIEKALASQGVLFCTGVGKSGFIAQKICATLMSTGTKSFFLPPIDAVHGDLGMVSSSDCVLVFSKSGETEELVQLLPFIRSKGALTCAITSAPESRLAQGADFSIHLPCQQELCPFDLAPTTSSEIQLLFGDLLAMTLMGKKQFSLDQYAQNHPAGSIGKRASLKVSDLMLDGQRAPICSPEDTLENVLVDFTNKKCGCMIVVDENKRLQGIFTDGDLRRALQAKGDQVLQQKVGDLMTKGPRTVLSEQRAFEAMRLMESNQKSPITVLPVLDQATQEVIGILKMHDLIQAGL